MELRPQQSRGRLIEAYGDGCFRVAGTVLTGSILIALHGVRSWRVTSVASETAEALFESFAPVTGSEPVPEILLVGCGIRGELLPSALRHRLKELGIAAESMDTGAACRTYNVLVGEERLVAAALVAVS